MRQSAYKQIPNEYQEMVLLAEYLDLLGLLWFHPVNEGKRSWGAIAMLKKTGMRAGVPDALILSRVPGFPEIRGVAIELKRSDGGVLSEAQDRFLERLDKEGWLTCVAHGFDDAKGFLKRIGLAR